MSSFSGNWAKDRCGSPSFPGCPHVPLPRSQIPVRPPRTWPAPREGGDLLCAWRCWPPWGQQEVPDDVSAFEIQSRGFDTCSIRFTHPLRVCCAMFASERLPTFLGWECLPTGHRFHVSSSFRWFPHVLVAGARPRRTAPIPPQQLEVAALGLRVVHGKVQSRGSRGSICATAALAGPMRPLGR